MSFKPNPPLQWMLKGVTLRKPRKGTPDNPYEHLQTKCPACKTHNSISGTMRDKHGRYYWCPACGFTYYMKRLWPVWYRRRRGW